MSHFAGPVHAPSEKNSDPRRPAARPQPRRLPPSQQAARWQALQLKAAERETAPAAPAQAAAAQSRGGLPARLKAGVERLSGLFMDDVRVHRDSPEPAKLGALAYTKGSDIHLAPGQERHLPHEAWHVVQQKQGRVNATAQMKSGTPLNEDPGLELEADVMGLRAAALGAAASDAPPSRAAPPPGQAPVQRYKVVGKYHVSNDDTAAVVDVKNNKELYATGGRIAEANTVLNQRLSNVRLVQNARSKTSGDQQLFEATPMVHAASVRKNVQDPLVAPKDNASKTGVEMPSECERGAIAIIGAFVQDHRLPANLFVYERKKHENARIANLIAQSTASPVQKGQWYAEWTRLNDLRDKASDAFEKVGSLPIAAADIDPVRAEVRTTRANIADASFNARFALADGNYATRPTVSGHRVVVKEMIGDLDGKINAIEHAVMSDVDVTYQGLHQNVLAAQNLRAQLVQLYAAHDFPKATIDAALTMAAKTADLAKYFAVKAGDANTYVNNLNFFTVDRMRSFLEEVVGAIDAEILNRENARNKRFGAGATTNEQVDPAIGQAYGIIGGHFDFSGIGRWNWHWAGVILKTGTDNVTMEAHASHKVADETHNEHWDFKMYGRPQALAAVGTTFHDVWRDRGFGQAPVTVLGEPAPSQDVRVNQYQLAGLSVAQVEQFRDATNRLYSIEFPMKDRSHSKDQLVPYYYRNIEAILGLAASGLPRHFVEQELHGDLNEQYEAFAQLKDEDSLATQIDLELAIARTADAVTGKLVSLISALGNYERDARKSGAIVP